MLRTRRPLTALALATTSTVTLTAALISPATAQTQSTTGSSAGSSAASSAASSALAGEPKNIIYMIGDGMGYNHVAATNFYDSGQSRYQIEGDAGQEITVHPGEAVQVYEGPEWDLLGMSTYQHGNSYGPERTWSDHSHASKSFTDSAAAGTAMATGTKTDNGKLGVDPESTTLGNTSEHAIAQGKSAGVVSSVPFAHATPAAWAAHNASRNDNHGIADEMLASDLSVIFGPGHPFFDDNNQPTDSHNDKWLSEDSFAKLTGGETGFTYFDDDATFEALAAGDVEPGARYFGLPQVAETLQYNRDGDSVIPYDIKANEVVDLATMSTAALNVLGQNDEGFHVMIEAGAIDWAGHANDTPRDIEEVRSFNDSIEAVVDWVESNSSWDETLVIVTADHETGYLAGPEDNPDFSPMHGAAGEIPNHAWFSDDHTNHLVPFFFRGAGSEDIRGKATNVDPVRGNYIDNTDVANLTKNTWWARD